MAAFGKVITSEKSLNLIGPYRLRDGDDEYRVHIGSLHPIKKHEKITELGIITRDISADIESKTLQPEPAAKKTNNHQFVPENRLVMGSF